MHLYGKNLAKLGGKTQLKKAENRRNPSEDNTQPCLPASHGVPGPTSPLKHQEEILGAMS